MGSSSGNRRKFSSGGRSARDPSTDSLELASLDPSRRTQTIDNTDGWPTREDERVDVEANVILIAHPENKMLGTRFRLSSGAAIEIGRSPAAEISLPEVLSVSRAHARLRYENGVVMLEDLKSTNGTLLNDQPLAGRKALNSGDRFQVGSVHFKFLQERDPEHAYHEAIYNLVMRDGLTEIYNKRKHDEEAEREFARAARHDRPLSLVIFDLDSFKNVNDSYGHLCGDFVLKQVATLAAELLRPEQVFARVGGEEFAILCPETNLEGALQLAEKLRERFETYEFQYAGFRVPVTCSFGVADRRSRMRGPQELYEEADRALYVAKHSGRNRVSLAEPDEPKTPAAGGAPA
ncbi:MAG: GGDEF domain-containing protein [Acidobacteriota bacterium]